MAYMNQEKKAAIAAELKKVIPADWKYSLAVRNHSTLVLTIQQAPVDLIGHVLETQDALGMQAPANRPSYLDINEYHLDRQFRGEMLELFSRIKAAMNLGNWDNSDIQTDYFDVGHYIDIRLGRWDAPFLDVQPAPAGQAKPPRAAKSSPLNSLMIDMLIQQGALPMDYLTLSPGLKAAATKRAKAAGAIA